MLISGILEGTGIPDEAAQSQVTSLGSLAAPRPILPLSKLKRGCLYLMSPSAKSLARPSEGFHIERTCIDNAISFPFPSKQSPSVYSGKQCTQLKTTFPSLPFLPGMAM